MAINKQLSDLSFTERVLQAFSQWAEEKTLSKGDFLLREGEVERHLYLIQKGAVRVLYLTDVESHTIRLGYDGSMINSLSSFLNGKPSEFYIEAIRQTTIHRLHREQLMEIVNQSPESRQQYAQFLEVLVAQQIEREIDLLTSSPTERLQRVLERSPNLFQHVPLKYIAAYLRMKPETLSRIRNS